MKNFLCTVSAVVALTAIGTASHAGTTAFSFNGGPFSGSGTLTYAPDVSPTDPNPLCGQSGQNACRADPVGADAITSITGTFSDSNLGISNAAITGLVPVSPANEHDPVFDPLVPSSLSFVGPLSYNNLFFPNGSPIDCDYPFSGTYLDVFGAAFTIAGGDTVVFWGDGAEPVLGRTYGVGVTDGVKTLDYQFDGVSATPSIPEPSTWALMLLGLIGLGGAMRFARRERATASFLG
ncbi:MAG TPA: PEP-CTERM sorting domain-containing protein [Caulobacteraceae bacterium]|jgi:hypothetical protein